jgi:glucokinase
MPNFSIGVDLGGTNLRIAAIDEHGTLMEKITLGTKTVFGRDQVLNNMCDAIQQTSEKYRRAGDH